MVYIPLTSESIDAGEPNSQDLWSKVKGNADDHETRILTLEGSLSFFNPISFGLNGNYQILGNMDNYAGVYRITTSLTITAVRLFCRIAGSGGTTETNILFKRGAGAWTSVLNTNPSLGFAAGDDSLSSNAVLNSTNKFLEAGDLIRGDLVSSQSGEPRGLVTFAEIEKT
jgi:hypothetical protein